VRNVAGDDEARPCASGELLLRGTPEARWKRESWKHARHFSRLDRIRQRGNSRHRFADRLVVLCVFGGQTNIAAEWSLNKNNEITDHGMEYLHLPIPDFSIPSLEQAEKFVSFVDEVSEGTTFFCYT